MIRDEWATCALLGIALGGVASGTNAERPHPPYMEASLDLPALEQYAERLERVNDATEIWGIGRRHVEPHDPFPVGGGCIDD